MIFKFIIISRGGYFMSQVSSVLPVGLAVALCIP